MARNCIVKVRLNSEELAWLDEMVKERGTTRSETLRHKVRADASHKWVIEEHAETFRKLAER